MATIVEALLYAPAEAQEFFLLRCDDGLHAGACEWLRDEIGQELEERLDYAHLRERAKKLDDDREHPVAVIQAQRQEERETGVRDCWYCGNTIAVARPNCPACGRSQNGGL